MFFDNCHSHNSYIRLARILQYSHNIFELIRKGATAPPLKKRIIGPSLGRGDLDARLDADGHHHINIFARTEAEDEADVSGKLTSSNA